MKREFESGAWVCISLKNVPRGRRSIDPLFLTGPYLEHCLVLWDFTTYTALFQHIERRFPKLLDRET